MSDTKIWLQPLTLQGNKCELVPLQSQHAAKLSAAVQDGELWKLWYTLIPEPANMSQEIARRLELQQQGAMIPFTVIDIATNTIVGQTTYLNLSAENKRLEIGGTWLSKSSQGTGINTEAKYLLLRHAFEVLDCNVVEIRTHFFNQQSRKGIERLGAKLDGILRNNMIMPDGTLRDTCVYSIVAAQWPAVKKNLQFHLGRGDISLSESVNL